LSFRGSVCCFSSQGRIPFTDLRAAVRQAGWPIISFRFNQSGARKFGNYTLFRVMG